ncbi:adenosylcobinamide kinase [Vibrio variabilis]|uniref:Bifunctional adenosylcobalamin biosynthesis protein n=1 Tax=Vibrio variabilis TaxID=990271 RepID=A0ABR4YB12_9VIBR|nr:bifunctional adenosylcobinamide kinase/adenosylcobinamide-phosphate guanylyltransferase [Vibrio variabilis]KHA60662.1 adenosylcobinamide kinase [Vibrio variabilis]
MAVHLILGGARSGKSSYAETLIRNEQGNRQRHYVATAQVFDEEMSRRVAHHRQRRGNNWQEHECPYDLPSLLARFTHHDIVLVDCLTLWMNNVIYNHGETASEAQIRSQASQLVDALDKSTATFVIVSNEVGLGVIPMGEVTRLFVDHAGWMNQAVAKIAENVTFIAAGLPMQLKGAHG